MRDKEFERLGIENPIEFSTLGVKISTLILEFVYQMQRKESIMAKKKKTKKKTKKKATKPKKKLKKKTKKKSKKKKKNK